jgi:hypothetical protein
MGEKLTPRQFALLYNAKTDDKAQITFQKNKEREQFISNRDVVRILEEQKESDRRK